MILVSMKFGEESRISRLILSFQERHNPPLRPSCGTKKWLQYCEFLSLSNTTSSLFFVSIRNNMSGEIRDRSCNWWSKERWVCNQQRSWELSLSVLSGHVSRYISDGKSPAQKIVSLPCRHPLVLCPRKLGRMLLKIRLARGPLSPWIAKTALQISESLGREMRLSLSAAESKGDIASETTCKSPPPFEEKSWW